MKPRKPPPEQDDLLRARLIEMIDMRHELVKLANLIDWEVFEREWVGFFPSHTGRPAHRRAWWRGSSTSSTPSGCPMKLL
jgi:IS5 family transposase